MATAIRSSSTNSAATGTAVSVSAPSGVSIDDYVIVWVTSNGQTTIADNNGSTPFTEDLNDYKPNTLAGQTISVFSRRIVAGDPTTYNFTTGASDRWGVIAIALKEVYPSTPYDVAPTTATSSGEEAGDTNIDAPSITTNFDNAIHLIACCPDGSGNAVTGIPATYSSVANVTTNQAIRVVSKTITPAGATGAQTFTFGSANGQLTVGLAIRNYAMPIVSYAVAIA